MSTADFNISAGMSSTFVALELSRFKVISHTKSSGIG